MNKINKNLLLKNKIDVILNFYKSRKFDEVISRTKPLLKKLPKLIFLYNVLSLSYDAKGEHEKSVSLLNKAIKIEPNNILVLNNLGLVHSNVNNLALSENYLKRALEIKPNYLEASINLGNVKLELSQNEQAIKILKNVLNENKNNYYLNFTLGNAFQQNGNFEQAKLFFDNCLKIQPGNTGADKSISLMTKYNKNNEHLKRMKEKLNSKLSKENEMFLNFALGKAYEDCNDFTTSFVHYKKANDIKSTKIDFNINNEKKKFQNLKNLFLNSSSQIQENTNSSNKTIIFVLGMPRSGTSLIEQILSSHNKVYGAGELSYIHDIIQKKFKKDRFNFIRDKIDDFSEKNFDEFKNEYLSSLNIYNFNESYMIDKAPLNFKWIGFILKILPNCKIIHCNRDPMDICWSNYKNYFASKKLNFTYNFFNLGEYYKLYYDLMQFWNSLYKNKIYNISYESLTTNPEEEIRKLIDFCGLKWDNNCLNFHKNKKNVSTASLAQVRRPIYKSSVKGWQNYLNELSELKKLITI